MKKSWLIATTALMLAAGSAFAADDKAPAAAAPAAGEHGEKMGDMMGGEHHRMHKDMTLEQAREHAHKRAAKLDKMTQEEWDAKKKQRMERRAKWKALSPEEKQKIKEDMRAKRMQRKGAGEAAPSAQAPAAGEPAKQ